MAQLNELKKKAIEKANSGKLGTALISKLAAEVKPAALQKIQTINSNAVNARTSAQAPASTPAPNNPQSAVNVAQLNPNIASAIDNQFNSGLNIGRDFYNTPEFQKVLADNPVDSLGGKLSEADVAKYAMSKGYGLGDQYQAEFGTINTPGSIKQSKKLREAIKIAAASGVGLNVVDAKEQNKIFNKYQDQRNLDSMKFAGILDKMNARGETKGKAMIGLSGQALNRLASDKYGGNNMYSGMFSEATNGLSGVLRGMSDRYTYGGAGDGAGYTKVPGSGKFDKRDAIYGMYNTGQFKDSPGLGTNWATTKFGQSIYEPTATADPTKLPGAQTAEEPTTPTTPEDPATPDATQLGASTDLASFAARWSGRKGKRAMAGKSAQGLKSQLMSPQNSGGIGVNYG